MKDIDKFRQEIKRLRQEIKDEKDPLAPNQKAGYLFALTDMESFLDSLQEETPTDLEQEITRYLYKECSSDDEPSVSEIARHFYGLGQNSK